jgi:hypothetical protein
MDWHTGRSSFVTARRSLVVYAALFVISCFTPIQSSKAEVQGLAKGDITYFYKNPDLDGIPGFLSLIDSTGAVGPGRVDNRPSIMGFLAALFERYPERIDSWIAGRHSRHVQQVVGFSLSLAGKRDKTVNYLKKNGWPRSEIDRIFGQMFFSNPDLLTSPIIGTTDLDVLWGASFATGNRAYPKKIIDHVATVVDSGKYRVEDIMYFAPPPQNLGKVKDDPVLNSIIGRYKRKDLNDLLMNGVAVWGLGSNALQHEFVMELIQERIAEAPSSDLSYALRKSMFRSSYPLGAKLEGKEIQGVVSLTSRTELNELVNSSTGIESLKAVFKSLESVFRNEFGRNDPISVAAVFLISPGEVVDYRFEIISPSGSSFVLGPSEWQSTGGKHKLSAMILPIDPSRLSEEGVYQVNGVISDGEKEKLETKNAFFFGKR